MVFCVYQTKCEANSNFHVNLLYRQALVLPSLLKSPSVLPRFWGQKGQMLSWTISFDHSILWYFYTNFDHVLVNIICLKCYAHLFLTFKPQCHIVFQVHGKRFVYKFVCDLKQLLGYSAFELNRLVIEAEMRAQNSANDPLQHSIFGSRQFSDMSWRWWCVYFW